MNINSLNALKKILHLVHVKLLLPVSLDLIKLSKPILFPLLEIHFQLDNMVGSINHCVFFQDHLAGEVVFLEVGEELLLYFFEHFLVFGGHRVYFEGWSD